MTSRTLSRRTALRVGASAAIASAWPLRASAGDAADVLILGAGISGLHAARMLRIGRRRRMLEGSGRIGGRCWTRRGRSGQSRIRREQVGFGYGRVRGNAADLGIA